MNTPVFPGGKRYRTYDGYLKSTFGGKIAKVSLNANLSCPNRDGTKSTGGCIYCSPQKSGDFAGDCQKSLTDQFREISQMMARKWPEARFLPYLQAGTNTYAPLSVLRPLYEEVLTIPGIVGLAVATRPDCLPEDILDYLAEINTRTFLCVELGLQSVSDKTGRLINRHTDYAEFLETYRALTSRGIRVCVHLINGLPGETREDMLTSVRAIASLKPHAIKLHMLHILKDTVCEMMYREGRLAVFEKEDYIRLICDELELIFPETVIQRITGDGARDALVAPLWSVKKFDVINGVDKEMARRNAYQGDRFDASFRYLPE